MPSRRSLSILTLAVLILLTIGARPLTATPAAVTVMYSPTGAISGSTIVFTWKAVPGVTWYYLWVEARPTSFGSASLAYITVWYTADQAGCGTGAGACSATVTTGLPAGPFSWWIRTYDSSGNGPWSAEKNFTMLAAGGPWNPKLPDNRRFLYVMDGEAILDYETGLVWLQQTGTSGETWTNAIAHCMDSEAGTGALRRGWRLPSFAELQTLFDTSRSNPALPAGHPFSLPSLPASLWTTTDVPGNETAAVTISLGSGARVNGAKTSTSPYRWCVRAGSGREVY